MEQEATNNTQKRKIWPYIVGGVFIIAVIVLLIVFIISPWGESGDAKDPDLKGTWKVVATSNYGQVTFSDDRYIVFDETTVKLYENGNTTEPSATSSYDFGSSAYATAEVHFPDLSKNYQVDIKTKNYVCLYENEHSFTELVRYKNADMSAITEEVDLSGSWNLVYRNTNADYAGQRLVFENGVISQFLPNKTEAALSVPYTYSGRHILIDSWGKDLVVLPVDDTTIIFVELKDDSGAVWELKK